MRCNIFVICVAISVCMVELTYLLISCWLDTHEHVDQVDRVDQILLFKVKLISLYGFVVCTVYLFCDTVIWSVHVRDSIYYAAQLKCIPGVVLMTIYRNAPLPKNEKQSHTRHINHKTLNNTPFACDTTDK